MNAALPTVFTSVPLIVPTSNSGGSSVRLGSGAPFRASGRLASADLPSSAKSAWHRVQTARDNPQICCIMQQRPSRSPNASWHHLQQGRCIVFSVLFGNVARGAVRYSRRLRSRPLQPFLSGLLFKLQSHASYLFQKLAIAMDQPCCSTADHASLPQETASKDCATLAWSAMRPSSGWNTGSLTKRVIRRRDRERGLMAAYVLLTRYGSLHRHSEDRQVSIKE